MSLTLTNRIELSQAKSKINLYASIKTRPIKYRLLDPEGKLPDAVLKKIASMVESMHYNDQLVLIAIFKALFWTKKSRLSQGLIAFHSGLSRFSVNRSIKRIMRLFPELFSYTTDKNKGSILILRKNGFDVEESPDKNYKNNKIRENTLSYIPADGFVENLPYLAKLSPICGRIFGFYRESPLITHSKRNLLRLLGTEQVENFKRFSMAALYWARDRLMEMFSKGIRIRDKEGFLWSVCYRYDTEYGMLRE